MKNFLLLVALVFSFAFDANADATSTTICNIIDYTKMLGGPMITIVIIGAALLAIFGRMPWPALFALGMFTAAFFGAPAIVTRVTGQAVCTSSTTTSTTPTTKAACTAAGRTWSNGTCN